MGRLCALCANGFVCCNSRTGCCSHYLFVLSALSLHWPVHPALNIHYTLAVQIVEQNATTPQARESYRGPWSIGNARQTETQTSSRGRWLSGKLKILEFNDFFDETLRSRELKWCFKCSQLISKESSTEFHVKLMLSPLKRHLFSATFCVHHRGCKEEWG